MKKTRQIKSQKQKAEHIEGVEARENFDQTMKSLFRIPKSVVAAKIKNKAKKGKD